MFWFCRFSGRLFLQRILFVIGSLFRLFFFKFLRFFILFIEPSTVGTWDINNGGKMIATYIANENNKVYPTLPFLITMVKWELTLWFNSFIYIGCYYSHLLDDCLVFIFLVLTVVGLSCMLFFLLQWRLMT